MSRSTIPLDLHLNVTPQQLEEAGILNVILGVDTKLFIDPKLIDKTDIPEFTDAGKLISAYADQLIRINAQAPLSKRVEDIALRMIAIKEPKGLSIGYGNSRDSGTAIPLTVAQASLNSLREMVEVGIRDLEVMEMLGLFIKKFGADSISDLIAHIIYDRLCQFTQRVSAELGVTTQEFTLTNGTYQLPKHPFKNHQVIFVPLNLLSPLPLATSWEEVKIAAQMNERVRADFNALVGTNVKAYAKGVRRNPNLLVHSAVDMRKVLDAYKGADVKPYDIDHDIKSYYRLAEFASQLQRNSEVQSHGINDVAGMIDLIQNGIISSFRRHIEQLGANSLLYQRTGARLRTVDPTKPVHEDAVQILFHLIADDLCSQDDVMVARESTTGSAGAVDFSLGTGYQNKVLVEIKKSNNQNLLDGYKNQVGRYVEGENAADAFYLIVVVRASDLSNPDSQLNQVKELHAQRIRDGKPTPRLEVVNGLITPTGSQMHS